MEFIVHQSTDKELDAMKGFAEEMVDDSIKKRRLAKEDAQSKPCDQGGKHKWLRKWKNKNVLLRFCEYDCGVVKKKVFRNQDLQYVEKYAHLFAQPGTAMWEKVYGKKTQEQVRLMNQQ